MQFVRDRRKRTVYDERFTAKERMKITKPVKISTSPDKILTKECVLQKVKVKKLPTRMAKVPYKSILGQPLYIAITARPDISTAVSACGRYSHNHGQEHWDAVLQIVAYLMAQENSVSSWEYTRGD